MSTVNDEYGRLAHAIQTGIAYTKDRTIMEPKHLRVGVDLRAVEHGALVSLLIKKGLITKEEYTEELLEYMEQEVKNWEKRLREEYGHDNITLA